MFLEAHRHQGQTGSRSWGTAPSGLPERCFKNKSILQQLLLGSKDTVWVGTKVSIDPLILVACWEQLLGDSTIWSLRKLFFKEKFTKNSYYPIFKSQPGSVL